MTDSEALARLGESNNQLSRFYKNRTEYDHVTVLALYWKECSDSGFKTEAVKLGELMKTKFNYHFEYFEIPSFGSQLALDIRLNELLATNRQANTLIIIHYGGHGELDDDNENQSVWAA